MFTFEKKVRRSWLNTTDSFLTEMLRAILKEMVDDDVLITQIRFKAQKIRKPEPSEIVMREYTKDVREVEVSAFFTSLTYPRRHGREGVFPVLPKATAKFVLTNEAAGWYSWDLLLADVRIQDWFVPIPKDEVKWAFDHRNPYYTDASDNLLVLAEELRMRGPARLSEDE